MSKKNRLILIDGHSLIYRAFHAYPPLTTTKGELINAAYGFTSILLNTIKELEPTHLAVTFDKDKPTFRHTEFVGYKAQREKMPTELASQIKRVEQVVKTLNIPAFAVEGFEADDVIGTLAKQAQKTQNTQKVSRSKKSENQKTKKSGSQKLRISDKSGNLSNPSIPKLNQVIIVTGDMDALQLVDSDKQVKVRVYIPGRRKIPAKLYDQKQVEEKYSGLQPKQIPDLKGLAGDPSDNIPGIRGVGPKTAIALLQKFNTIEKLYQRITKNSQTVQISPNILQKLLNDYQQAILSKKLATIVTNVPIKLNLEKCRLHSYNKTKAIKLFNQLEFKSLINKLPKDEFEIMIQETLL